MDEKDWDVNLRFGIVFAVSRHPDNVMIIDGPVDILAKDLDGDVFMTSGDHDWDNVPTYWGIYKAEVKRHMSVSQTECGPELDYERFELINIEKIEFP